ncbi:YggT family protein [Marinobacterium sp. AK62]|uniref:YggT family protein n=1 Tax=Marinobacterium alkalitolerans TaxID=1542925 RepID=A0ABS3Z8A5_9GAMM|nr:YggT family protein [Marinobacterium alkalitolerans]MBP0047219.1 YggT family protein [Marinobacterium alkalitolerans]
MGQDPITLIIRTLGELYAFILVLRFLLQLARADYYNPISQAVVRLTQPPVRPLQMLFRPRGRFDASPLVLAVAVKAVTLLIIVSLANISGALTAVQLLAYSVVGVIDSILTIYFWAVIGAVIISWVSPDSPHPAPQLLLQLTEPLFALARKVIPPIGGLDLSPILIFLVIQILQSQLGRLLAF